ncbi:MAG: DUF975 family protein [Oscillospiraceae bacterium]|nr:DUF975 family protein [Oscillospiraceae bacterium]
MFDRKRIKANAKRAFKANYWRCVIVAFIIVAVIGGGASSGRSSVQHSVNENETIMPYDLDKNGTIDFDELKACFNDMVREYGEATAITVAGTILGIIGMVATAGSLLTILVINPLSFGCSYFFSRNGDAPAELGDISRGFTPAWWNNVVTGFLSGLFLVLWAVLFFFPAFVKVYSYRLAPYIQAEHPEMHGTEAITLSRRMMNGHKWDAFVFDLSFIGWYILVGITAGIAGVLWVHPYKASADAELYRTLRDSYDAQA